jgi:hypothetical protein
MQLRRPFCTAGLDAATIERIPYLPMSALPSSALGPLWLSTMLCAIGGCNRDDGPLPRMRTVAWDDLGATFEVPAAWTATTEAGAAIFTGPENTESQVTTLSVQVVRPADDTAPLTEEVASVQDSLMTLGDFAWFGDALESLQGRLSISYGATYELHDVQRDQIGVVIDDGGVFLLISYHAPAAQFSRDAWVFDHVLDTLVLGEPGPWLLQSLASQAVETHAAATRAQ